MTGKVTVIAYHREPQPALDAPRHPLSWREPPGITLRHEIEAD